MRSKIAVIMWAAAVVAAFAGYYWVIAVMQRTDSLIAIPALVANLVGLVIVGWFLFTDPDTQGSRIIGVTTIMTTAFSLALVSVIYGGGLEASVYLEDGRYKPVISLFRTDPASIETIKRRFAVECTRSNREGLRAEFLYQPTEEQLSLQWRGNNPGQAEKTLRQAADTWLRQTEKSLPAVNGQVVEMRYDVSNLQPSFPGLKLVRLRGYPSGA